MSGGGYFHSGDNINAVVADIGAYATKIGFAGEDYPKSYFRSNTAILELHDSNDDNNNNNSNYHPHDDFQIRYDFFSRPMKRDDDYRVVNPVDIDATGLWYGGPSDRTSTISNKNTSMNAGTTDDANFDPINPNNHTTHVDDDDGSRWYALLEKYLQHGYESSLNSKLHHHPLLLVERSYNPPPLRQAVLELLMEDRYGNEDNNDQNNPSNNGAVPGVFLGRDATLACYACGRTTGTVVDIGYSGTTITPVYEGYVETKGIRRLPVGTAQLDEELCTLLDQHYSRKSSLKKTTTATTSPQFEPFYRVQQMKMLSQQQEQHNVSTMDIDDNESTLFQLPSRRQDAIHRLCRMQVAQECREQGIGIGISATSSSMNSSSSMMMTTTAAATTTLITPALQQHQQQDLGFTAPSQSFELPDGTIIDVPSKERFHMAHLLLGGDDEETEENKSSSSFREARTSFVKKKLTLRIQQSEQINMSSSTQQRQQQSNNNNHNENDKDDEEYYEQVYSEGASVGLLKRRQDGHEKRGRYNNSSGKNNKKNKQHHPSSCDSTISQQERYTYFATRTWKHLQKACSPYIMQLQQDWLSSASIPSMVCDAAFQCDRDQQASLLGNVVLAGGGACIGPTDSALPDAIRDAVERIIHPHTPGWRVKVTSPNMTERAICSWLGGSILASLGTFHDMWITKKEYEEWGSAIVNRKCP